MRWPRRPRNQTATEVTFLAPSDGDGPPWAPNGIDLAATVRLALEDADLDADRLHVLPFPLYQWRQAYVRGLASLVASART